MIENLYIKLKNEYYLDSSITNEQLVIYILIKRSYCEGKHISFVSINSLLDYMYIRHDNSRFVKDIREAIKGLIDKGLINCIYDIYYNQINLDNIDNKTTFVVESEPYNTDYFPVYEDDLNKIFSYLKNKKIKKFGFVRYFIAVARTVNFECNFGSLTQKQCEKIINKNETISTYNKILQDELNIFRYCNNYYSVDEKKYCPTYFGKYDDENNFNQQINWIVEEKGLVKTDKIKSNAKRSKKQKEILEIKETVIEPESTVEEDPVILPWTEEDVNDIPESDKSLESYINNVDILRKFITYPEYWENQLKLIDNNKYPIKQFFDECLEFEQYEDYIEFVKEQIKNKKIEICSCCGKKPVTENKDICKSCLDELKRSQYRAEQWKINNSNSIDDIEFEDLLG